MSREIDMMIAAAGGHWSSAARNCFSRGAFPFIEHLEGVMNGIIYLIGLIVVIGAILSFLGLR